MKLKLHDKSIVLIVLRKEGRQKAYQIQGIAVADEFAEAEKKARAICRDHTYFWIGPIPANCTLPHTAFHLDKNYPLERRSKPRRKRPAEQEERAAAGRKGSKGKKRLVPQTA